MLQRQEVLGSVADRILRLPAHRISRVGVDGVDGAGKTMFADELAAVVRAKGSPVIRAGVDGFHNPSAVRYRRGRGSPEGFFEESYDYATLKAVLLDPLGNGGTGRYRTAAFDHTMDMPVSSPELQALPGSILVFDGIFLHRPELRDYWDVSIFLVADFAVSTARCAARDGTSLDPAVAANRRYVEGQRLYLRTCDPWARASLTIDNNDLSAPFIVRASN